MAFLMSGGADATISPIVGRFFTGPMRVLSEHRGFSGAIVWRVAVGDREIALRRWPPEGLDAEVIHLIHSVLRRACAAELRFVPTPIATADGHTTVSHDGTLWEASPWMPGSAQSGLLQRAKIENAVRSLAAFHQTTAHQYPTTRRSKIVRRRLELLDELDTRSSPTLGASRDRVAVLVKKIVSRLATAASNARPLVRRVLDFAFPHQPIIRDVRREHLLFTGDEVTGLIDYGAMTVDTLTVDIARLLGEIAGDDQERWLWGLEAYHHHRPLSREELLTIAALDASGVVLACANWLRWLKDSSEKPLPTDQITERLTWLSSRLELVAEGQLTAISAVMTLEKM